MKQVKIQQIAFDLLNEMAKKRRVSVDTLVEQLILKEYKNK